VELQNFLPLILFAIAFLYSSVGFGGGSSYLAILSLLWFDFYEIRSATLVLNIVVVGIGTFFFVRNRIFEWKSFWPFLLLSVPAAFFGARFRFEESVFFLILGSSLLAAALFMVLQGIRRKLEEKDFGKPIKTLLGGGIGLLAGLAGIGGGIFLSPTLNLLSWKNAKTIAALSSVFILFNSTAGLIGLVSAGSFQVDLNKLMSLVLAVALGGGLGSILTNSKINVRWIRFLTAVLVAYVGLKLLLLHGAGIEI
jgi:uncharacterized membrane protein YfcA